MLSACNEKDLRMNGTDMPYVYKEQKYTPAPESFVPFYINFVCRHGSRYPIESKYIDELIEVLSDAEKKSMITLTGSQLKTSLEHIINKFNNKWGLLSHVGVAEIQGIASRMIKNYIHVFDEAIYVQSDSAERCVKTMDAFIDVFKNKKDSIKINTEIVKKDNVVLNFFDVNLEYLKFKKHGTWKNIYNSYSDSILGNTRLLYKFFLPEYVSTINKAPQFLHALFKINAILPNTDEKISLKDFFTGEEEYLLWNTQNVKEYMEKGPWPGEYGLQTDISFPLLEDFLITSYNSIVDGGVSADFRFAHAETIIPFAAFLDINIASAKTMDINNVSNVWKDFEIAPMAANIMWIFYSNNDGEIIVKMLLNEKEVSFPVNSNITPYAHWEDIQKYYQNKLDALSVIPSLSTEAKLKYFKEYKK